jgi:glycosyltransferase involved in cell wall biosynthesis
MNVSFVNNAYHLGGAETVVRQLHYGLLKQGHQSRFYIAKDKNTPRLPGVVPMYPRLLSLLYYSRFHELVDRWAPRQQWTDRTFRKIADDPSEVVHIHNFHGTYASLESLLFLAARKPVVWTFHRFWAITGGCDHPGDCRRYFDHCGQCPRVNEWPLNGVDDTTEQLKKKRELLTGSPIHIVSPSKHLARTVAESPIGRNWKITCIPNGVDPNEFSYQRKHDVKFRQSLGLKPDAKVVLIVNRNFQDSTKGYQTIRDALPMIDPRGAQFVFAGGNSDWAIRQLPGHFSCVDMGFITSRGRIAELYEAADIFLYSSPGENFPCVILEAMSAQCCVVSTPTDGVIEQIEHGVSGLIADSFQPEDLAKTLSYALSSQDKLREYAQSARKRVDENFTEAGMIQAHLSLYQSLVS